MAYSFHCARQSALQRPKGKKMRYHFKAKAKSLVCVKQERMTDGASEYHFAGYPVAFATLAELTEWYQKWYR